MKHLVLTSVAVVGLLMMAGCSSKTPEVDANQQSGVSSEDALLSQIQSNVGNVYFDFDKFNVRPDMQSVVSNNAQLFKQAGAENFNIKVEGNCDEWGTGEYNYALGLKRAKVVKDALTKQGVQADKISVVSYGKNNPVCSEKSKDCDAKNRRDEFKITK